MGSTVLLHPRDPAVLWVGDTSHLPLLGTPSSPGGGGGNDTSHLPAPGPRHTPEQFWGPGATAGRATAPIARRAGGQCRGGRWAGSTEQGSPEENAFDDLPSVGGRLLLLRLGRRHNRRRRLTGTPVTGYLRGETGRNIPSAQRNYSTTPHTFPGLKFHGHRPAPGPAQTPPPPLPQSPAPPSCDAAAPATLARPVAAGT